MMLGPFALLAVLSVTTATYQCVCSYYPTRNVYDQMSTSGQVVGIMKESDCKPLANLTGNPAWIALQIEHKLGYIETGEQVEAQACEGNPSTSDLLTSSGSTDMTTGMMSSTSGMMSSTSGMMSSTMLPVVTSGPLTGGTYGCSQKYYQFAANENGVLFTIDDTCYELVPTQHTWSFAEGDCRQRGGHLVTIDTAAKQNVIYEVVKNYQGSNVWIGLHDKLTEDVFQWVSGDQVSFTNWYPGHRNPFSHTVDDCVSLWLGGHAGQWEDERCTHYYAYICEFDAVTGSAIGTTGATLPPQNLIEGDIHLCPLKLQTLSVQYQTTVAQHGNSCYELLHNRVTWAHAENLCHQAGGHLADIGDAAEQQYIQTFMMQNSADHAVWIGLNDHNTEGAFQWTSGKPVIFTNWIPGHNDNFVGHNLEDCVAFVPYKNGTWDDISCGSQSVFGDGGETHPGFCEYELIHPVSGVQIVG
ncbi:C-type mannose receptor 2-like [Mya arenaria]|uniref:C-type mannose receptor 2-like n=1 Tax=Mya arenaria TaxID=6604 RepID=UPI0022E7279D|nr:C-type mannose receptor 2-like [Mya arenaria]